MTHGSEAGWRRMLPWLKGPIGLGLIAFLIHKHWDAFANFLQRPIEWRFLALGCGICIVSVVLTFLRWYLLVWAQQFKFSVSDAVRLGFMGCLLNYVGPGALGGGISGGPTIGIKVMPGTATHSFANVSIAVIFTRRCRRRSRCAGRGR